MRRNLYFNLEDPVHKRAFEIYSQKKGKADFICRAIIAFEENAPERLEERIRKIEDKLDELLQNKPNKLENAEQRVKGILEMHELFKSE